MDDRIDKSVSPGLHTFDDQSKEDVVNLLKKDCDVNSKHGDDCTCTWCTQDCRENLKNLLTPELPKKEGKVDPDVYVFADQTKEQVKELIEKANNVKKIIPNTKTVKWERSGDGITVGYDKSVAEMMASQRSAEASYPTPKKPVCLVGDVEVGGFEKAYSDQPDIRKGKTSEDFTDEAFADASYLAGVDESEDICQLGPLWRKLSGVRPTEHVYEDKTVDNLLDKIIIELDKALPKMDFAWSDDRCYNQVLLVNKARTRFSVDPLIAAYEAVNFLTGKEEAEKVIVSIIKKKVCSLFI